jgi:hypothetical protein
VSRAWSDQQTRIFSWFRGAWAELAAALGLSRELTAEERANLVVRARAGTGKCLAPETPVLRYDGSIVRADAVRIGDLLMGPDSTPREVIGTTTGRAPMFRIVPKRGQPWICNDVHVLTLAGTNREAGKTRDVALDQLLRESAERGARPDRDWKLFAPDLVEFPAIVEPAIDPYFLGLWFGDGTKEVKQGRGLVGVAITKPDPEVHDACETIAARYGLVVSNVAAPDRCPTWTITKPGATKADPNPLTLAMRRMLGAELRVPREILVGSIATRLSFLAGIIDSDGYVVESGAEVSQKRRDWIDAISFVARSLGIRVTTRETIVNGDVYWRAFLSGHMSHVPTRIARKRIPERAQIKNALRWGFDVEPLGVGDYAGFELDGDGRFLLGDFTVTHNTTSIVEAIRHAPEGKILLAAFNKKIADELTARLSNPAAESKTLHSVGYAAIRRFVNAKIDPERGRREDDLAAEAAPGAPKPILRLVAGLHTKAREVVPLAERPEELLDLAAAFDFVPDEEWADAGYDLSFVARAAVDAMRIGAESAPKGIDFADMIFLPIRNRWLLPSYDLVVVDEAQDMTVAQLMIARGVCRPGGRIAVVGDDRQAIYRFRGADSESLDRLKAELSALELGLTTTYRCGRAIVERAKEIVPDFEAGPANPPGEIAVISIGKLVESAEPGDFVLSRKNAPLARIALGFLRAKKRAKVAGRDVGAKLRKLVQKLAVGRAKDSLPEFTEKLGAWEEREIVRAEKLGERRSTSRIEEIQDLAETIRGLSEELSGVPELLARIEDLFVDEPGRAFISCSSIHRSKGLEADRVFVLADTLRPPVPCQCGHRHAGACSRCGCPKDRPDEKRAREEANLAYVAITRAKEHLYLVVGLP